MIRIQLQADPEVEQAVMEVLSQPIQVGNKTIQLALVHQTIAPMSGHHVQVADVPMPESLGPRLTLKDLVINVLQRTDRALTTREVFEGVKSMRGSSTNQNSVYNTLRSAKGAKLVKYTDERWSLVPAR